METLERTTLDFVVGGDVILTEGMINAGTGQRVYGVFFSEEDARSQHADAHRQLKTELSGRRG